MKDRNVRRLSRFHRAVFKATGGRVGRRLVDNDILLLTTTGRRTGQNHSVPLLYLEAGEVTVVIASYGGRDRHPEWYLNLLEQPAVRVHKVGDVFNAYARTVGSDERAEWWPRIVSAYDGYAAYQKRTDRQIPVVVLEPVDS